MSAYCASKHAFTGFSDCLRREMKEFGVKVSIIQVRDSCECLQWNTLPCCRRARAFNVEVRILQQLFELHMRLLVWFFCSRGCSTHP